MTQTYPRVSQVVLDTTDARALAEFYRQMFGLKYRPGDEPASGVPRPTEDKDWLVLCNERGGAQLAFQQTEGVRASTWPQATVAQMLHLDTVVSNLEDLRIQRDRVLELGGSELSDQSDNEMEPLYVFADPQGHPFCIFVG